ncbi:MAG TPA: hypothetical protein VFZ59_11635 [Verrucomicrobiae bacterium]|nr:hypothetical protein [Verrucomicrobiae bacterium]
MIPPGTAAAAIAVVNGLIKLGRRLDVLLAEKEAVQSGKCILPMPKVGGLDAGVMARDLNAWLAEPANRALTDLPAGFRDELKEALRDSDPTPRALFSFYRLAYPERAVPLEINPDAEFVKNVRAAWPTLDLTDRDTLTALFHVASGQDARQITYGLRVGLLVTDVLAEFGAENTAWFVRDDEMRAVVQKVLERFAKPDLESFTAWSSLLQHALKATLNGVLEARSAWSADNPWLTVILDVLADARAQSAEGDEYLMGLLQGRGYRLLLSEGLVRAADAIAEDHAQPFRLVAGDVLKRGAELWREDKSGFGEFFAAHWGDLLNAGLNSVERNGDQILAGASPLLKTTLLATLDHLAELAAQDKAHLFAAETLFGITNAAIAAAAQDPEVLTQTFSGKPWLKVLLESVVKTVSEDDIRRAFSKQGLERIIGEAASVFAEHPELIIEDPDMLQKIVGDVLRSVSKLDGLSAKSIATAVVGGTLQAISANPGLLETRYAKLLSDFAGRLATLVAERQLTGLDASGIAAAAAAAMLKNPVLFDELEGNLATVVLDAVLKASGESKMKLLVGDSLVSTTQQVLQAIAAYGRDKASAGTLEQFGRKLGEVIAIGLARAEKELGRCLDLPALPTVLAGLAATWLRSRSDVIAGETPAFRKLFAKLAAAAMANPNN